MGKNEKVGIAGSEILNPDKTKQYTCWRWPKFFTFLYRRTFLGTTKKGKKHLHYFLYRDKDLTKNCQVDWILGGCFLIRKKALDEIGLFDERFFLFMEDTG